MILNIERFPCTQLLDAFVIGLRNECDHGDDTISNVDQSEDAKGKGVFSSYDAGYDDKWPGTKVDQSQAQ